MNIKEHWVAYCSGNPRESTEDDWNNFVVDTFLSWRERQLKFDPNTSQHPEKSHTDCAEALCGFTQFIEGTDTYQELIDFEPLRHDP
jgi:hypothetical protein